MTTILEIKGITKRYGGLTAVNNVSFDVAEREILSVIGPNGAGKSTLFKLISSFVPATSGEVRLLRPHVLGDAHQGLEVVGGDLATHQQGASHEQGTKVQHGSLPWGKRTPAGHSPAPRPGPGSLSRGCPDRMGNGGKMGLRPPLRRNLGTKAPRPGAKGPRGGRMTSP